MHDAFTQLWSSILALSSKKLGAKICCRVFVLFDKLKAAITVLSWPIAGGSTAQDLLSDQVTRKPRLNCVIHAGFEGQTCWVTVEPKQEEASSSQVTIPRR